MLLRHETAKRLVLERTYGCASLEELDHLCSLTGLQQSSKLYSRSASGRTLGMVPVSRPGRQLGSPSVPLKTCYPPKCIRLALITCLSLLPMLPPNSLRDPG
ncbi:unnamed protein product [Pleuronectes platessa]|uniref:Uncharacterized protein n=1 Tax=Pleuronectes platessa TaxID=8262 RepID=A0A9N7W0A9_PLEPL|nr:unnamed protein product [Pleuronectes platessa]